MAPEARSADENARPCRPPRSDLTVIFPTAARMPMKRRRRRRSAARRPPVRNTAAKKTFDQALTDLLRENPADVPILVRFAEMMRDALGDRVKMEKFIKNVRGLVMETPAALPALERFGQLLKAKHPL